MSNFDLGKFPTDFVPVSRPLVEELGYQCAYVFGIIWNYCQMESGVCSASHDRIGERAGMSRRSVMEHISKLIEKGYVEDLTPDVRNTPHQLSTKIGVQKLHTKEPTIKEEQPASEDERCENPAHLNGAGRQKLPSRYAKSAHPGRQKLPMNRQSQETLLIDSPNGADEEKSDGLTEPQAMFQALVDLCKYDLEFLTDKDRGRLNQFEKRMRTRGIKPDDIKSFEAWWYTHDWRGKQDQAPTLDDLYHNWRKFEAFKNGEKGGSNPKNGPGPPRASPKPVGEIDQDRLKKLQEGKL